MCCVWIVAVKICGLHILCLNFVVRMVWEPLTNIVELCIFLNWGETPCSDLGESLRGRFIPEVWKWLLLDADGQLCAGKSWVVGLDRVLLGTYAGIWRGWWIYGAQTTTVEPINYPARILSDSRWGCYVIANDEHLWVIGDALIIAHRAKLYLMHRPCKVSMVSRVCCLGCEIEQWSNYTSVVFGDWCSYWDIYCVVDSARLFQRPVN